MKRQLDIPVIKDIEDKQRHMGALSIVTRLYLSKIVKDAIVRGLTRGLPDLTIEEKIELTNHIMDEMGKDTEQVLEIVKQFFLKSE